jgi:PAS domain S-box-containing protein
MTPGPINVLLVEDSTDDALLMLRALRAAGLTVAAERVESAAALSEALLERDWDIVLCDFSVPGLGHAAVLELVGKHAAGTPVVLVTGTVGEEAVADLMRAGMVDVVLKDRVRLRLAAVVRREVELARERRAAAARERRIEAVLGLFQGASHWREALEASLGYLATAFGAEIAAVSEVAGEPPLTVPVASWATQRFTSLGAELKTHPPFAGPTLISDAVLQGGTIVVPRLQDRLAGGTSVRHSLAAAGVTALMCQPLAANGRKFGVTLMFVDPSATIHEIGAELAAISTALQPVLYRKISEDERTLLSDALEAALNGVLITEGAPLDPPGPRIVYANQAACGITGFDRRDLLGQTPRLFQGSGTDADALTRVRRALEAAQPVSAELLNYRRDGTPFWVEMNITPVREQGRVTHFIAIQTDTTERRKAEQERQQRDASFRLLFEDNPTPMWVYDRETLKFLEVNRAALARYGYSRDEFLARTVLDMSPPEDRERVRATIRAWHLSEVHSAGLHVSATGEVITVRVAGTGITYRGRQARLSAVWDVTEVERAREELHRKNEALAEMAGRLSARTAELEDAARLTRIGIWSMEFEPRRIVWSPEIFAIFGQDPEAFSLHSARIQACVHPDDRNAFREGYWLMMGGSADHQREFRIIRPSGEVRVLRELSRPKVDANGRTVGITGVIQDITEQKAAEDALLRTEKLKTLGQITGGIAHDFNNLLTVIGVNIEMVLESEALPRELREDLEAALHATLRSGELTGQMLSYARRQSLRPRLSDLQASVETLRPLLARAVGERHALRILPRGTELRVQIDPGQFENAVMNLVINARDALSAGGEITVSVEAARLQKAKAAVPDTIPPGEHVRVRVADNGHGIPPDLLPRIFEPFFTTKPLGTGSGLGLSMVYGFVHQSHGCMAVESVPGKGTTIDLYFPVSDVVTEEAAKPAAGPAVRTGRRTVLVVEDQDKLRQSIRRSFEKLGVETMSVASAEEAIELLHSTAKIDLLFTDIVLAGRLDGPQLAAAAEAIRPDLNIVLTSGDTREINPDPLKWPVLPKPFRLSALMAVL